MVTRGKPTWGIFGGDLSRGVADMAVARSAGDLASAMRSRVLTLLHMF